jgi:hypothetical protein
MSCNVGGMIPTWDSQSTVRRTFHYHMVQHKSDMDWPGIEHGLLW